MIFFDVSQILPILTLKKDWLILEEELIFAEILRFSWRNRFYKYIYNLYEFYPWMSSGVHLDLSLASESGPTSVLY